MKQVISQFENKLSEAFEFKYKNNPPEIKASLIEVSPVTRMNIRRFYDLYMEKGIYPEDRIRKLIYYLFDIKIEMFYVVELDLGLYNRLIYDLGFSPDNIADCPYMALRWLSLDQSLIIKSRILWERIMNFVYYLETGNELEAKSKKNKFFDYIKDTKWSFLGEYKKYIEWFDNQLRTPEVHKGSVLRKHFQAGSNIPQDRVVGVVNIAMNALWDNLLAVIQGHNPSIRYWTIAMNGVG